MNDKVGETVEEKVTEETTGGVAEEAGAMEATVSDTGEQPGAEDGVGADERRHGGGRGWFFTLFLFILLAVTAGASGYFILEIKRAREADRSEIQALTDRLDALQQSHASLTENSRRLDSRLTRTGEQLTGILHNLNSLQRERGGDSGWQLAEINYLLRIASLRLALVGDVDTVLAVLQSADAGLRKIPDPALIPVREQLIADINRLKTVPETDFTGLALALGDLAERADQLPLNPGAPAEESRALVDDPAETENRWNRVARSIWQELKSLLVISRTDRQSVALLAPRERFFLHRNLRLQLDAARLAVLIRDGDQLRESAGSCLDWLNEYFDTGDNRVRNAQEILERAAGADLQQPAPSINGTLNAFDKYLTRLGSPVTGGVVRQ
ncbi:MAG: uroporphyrinogen-III C-methyltransferase [Gammaproteobacteria bacterium]|nr:uroporphyrinogen-III C-methyltransferase [Gammaproteobacteria bacterium]